MRKTTTVVLSEKELKSAIISHIIRAELAIPDVDSFEIKFFNGSVPERTCFTDVKASWIDQAKDKK